MSTGDLNSSADGKAGKSGDIALRPLNAILEDPDENKSVTTDGGGFFSDDDEEDAISLPKFTPLAASSTKVNSSISNLIKQIPSSSSQDSTETIDAKVSTNLMDFGSNKNFGSTTMSTFLPKKMKQVDSNEISPEETVMTANDDPFGFLSEELSARITTLDNWDRKEADEDPFHLTVNHGNARKLIHPDSPISPADVDFTVNNPPETQQLKTELEAARREIADLVDAIHQKDRTVIDAYRKIEKLEHDALSEKKDGVSVEHRLETALTNATQLETRNILLRTQMDEMEQEHQLVAKSLRDVAVLLNMQTIPANDKELGIHLKAKVTSLLKSEADLSRQHINQRDLDNAEKNLIEDLANMRAAYNTEKMLRSQAEMLNLRNVEIRDSNILQLQSKLLDAEKKIRDQEEFGHALAAEARTLSEELKDTQMVIDRKNTEIQELYSALQKYSDSPLSPLTGIVEKHPWTSNANSVGVHNEELEAENRSLKEELANLRRKSLQQSGRSTGHVPNGSPNETRSRRNLSGRPSLLRAGTTPQPNQPNGLVTEPMVNGSNNVVKVKHELKILNAALAQVIATSNGTINALKTENLALLGRLDEHERTDPQLRHELTTKTQQIESLKAELAEVRENNQSAAPNGGREEEPFMEWSEILRQFKKDTTTQSISAQQNQIIALADALRMLQTDVQVQAAALSVSQSHVTNTALQLKADMLRKDTLEKMQVEADRQHEQDGITVLRKMLTEREDEIEHWRTVCAKLDISRLETQLMDSVDVASNSGVYYNDPPANQRHWDLNMVPAESSASGWMSERSLEKYSPINNGYHEEINATKPNFPDQHESQLISPNLSNEKVDSGISTDSEPQFLNRNLASSNDGINSRRNSVISASSTATTLTLPSVDYDGIRQRSRNQLAQLENLCQRIDQANEHYSTFLPQRSSEITPW